MNDEPIPVTRTPGKKGCLIALVVGGIISAGSMALSWKLVERQNEGVLQGAERLSKLMDESQRAPGATALQALGCEGAGVLSPDALAVIAQRLADAEAQKKKEPERRIEIAPEHQVVYCGTTEGHKPISCGELAAAYVAAVQPTADFVVTSRVEISEHCSEAFDRAGQSKGTVPSPNLPLLMPMKR